jgi:hypothetical protein
MDDVTKITINGREYDGVEQMPPEVREAYLLVMADMAKTGKASGVVTRDATPHSVMRESFIFNGREYKNRDELPPDVRALLDKMPALSPGEKRTEFVINTTSRTFSPKRHLLDDLMDKNQTPPEKSPAVAWLLVKILAVIVLILFFLLFLSSLKSKG